MARWLIGLMLALTACKGSGSVTGPNTEGGDVNNFNDVVPFTTEIAPGVTVATTPPLQIGGNCVIVLININGQFLPVVVTRGSTLTAGGVNISQECH